MSSTELDTSRKHCYPSENEFQRDVQASFSHDLESFYERHLITDVTLSIGGETLQVHKLILSARSPVFANMFHQDMAESTNNVVVIEDIKMATMKEVVAFMYGRARRDYDYDTALEIYYAADKYDIKQLKGICGCILVSKLDMGNAHQILQLAERHQDKWLAKEVIKFITFHSTQEMTVAENLLGSNF